MATCHQYSMCMNLLEPPEVNTKFLYKGDIIGQGNALALNYCIKSVFHMSGLVEPLNDQCLPPGAKEALLDYLHDYDSFPRYYHVY